MDHTKKQSGASSSSSFTETLFGPKDASSSSSSPGHFSSVFGPSSTGLGRDSSQSKSTGSSNKQDFEGPYGISKLSTPDYKTQKSKGEKERNPLYQNETAEPSYLSSSIYYGGQETYSPTSQTTRPQPFKKDGGDEGPNGSAASRGNWWQGSLYY